MLDTATEGRSEAKQRVFVAKRFPGQTLLCVSAFFMIHLTPMYELLKREQTECKTCLSRYVQMQLVADRRSEKYLELLI